MTLPTSSSPPPAREGLFRVITRQRRAADFLVLVAVAGLAMAALVAVGDTSFWGAVCAVIVLAAFALAYFAGTADLETEAIRAARDAAGDEERLVRSESERSFRTAMIHALPEPAMYIDAQGKVEAANGAARRQFRFLGSEPLLTAVVRRPEVLEAVEAARKQDRAQIFEFIERDETDRWFACVAAPLKTPSTSGVLVSMHDLTEVKRAEKARVDFLANASHELRTPLTSLSGYIETLRGPARDDPAARERFLEIMQQQADRMRRLIADLMSLSRIELTESRSPDTRADLAAAVKEVGDALLPLADARLVKLRISGPAAGVWVTGVRDELVQVAQNLIDNAIKYSDAGDVVEVEVLNGLSRQEASVQAGRRWEHAGHMSIATAPPNAAGRFAVLRVSDNGPGIDRQHLPRLAERFYRVEQERGARRGTGLGLAIVKHVVARHRGEFLVESEPGRGSAFGIVLPIDAAEPAMQPGAMQPGAVAGQGGAPPPASIARPSA